MAVLKLSQISAASDNLGSGDFLVGVKGGTTDALFSIAGATVTASDPIFDMSQTWNNAAVTFTGLRLNITNTASDGNSTTASRLVDVQVGGTSKFSVRNMTSQNGVTMFADAITLNGFTAPGVYAALRNNGDWWVFSSGFFDAMSISGNSGGVGLASGVSLSWVSGSDPTTAFDIRVSRNAAGVLQILRDTAGAAAGFQVYNTTDAQSGAPTNYERGVFDWTTTSNVLTIGTQAGGTGTPRAVVVSSSGAIVNVGTSALSLSLVADGNFSLSTSGGFIVSQSDGGGVNWISRRDVSTGIRLSSLTPICWAGSNRPDTDPGEVGFLRAAAKVVQFTDGTGNNRNGWFNYAGQSRVTSDFTVTSSTTLTTITGLTVNVQAGRTYTFEAEISWTDAAAGGIQAAIAGTATATNIVYDGWIIDSAANGIKGNAQATALGTAVASSTTTGTAGHLTIKGTITVNAAGTLLVQGAQNTSNGTATTFKRGSYFIVQDMP